MLLSSKMLQVWITFIIRNVKMSLDTTYHTKRLSFFIIDGQKVVSLRAEYRVIVTMQMDFEFSSFLHCVVNTAIARTSVWTPAWPICCSGWAWLTQIYFVSFLIWQHSLFLIIIAEVQCQCYSLHYLFVVFSFCSILWNEDANNGNSVSENAALVLWGLGHVLLTCSCFWHRVFWLFW